LYVCGDADRLGQVILNYLTNALKYAPHDRPITIRVEQQGEQGRVSVQDQGPGISAEEQLLIWEIFHRVPGIEVQSGSGIGLGLGLHISKTMIERQSGQVGVESVVGEGSTFWFSLPLVAQQPTENCA
jgi:signal transduction histidine kinase